MPVQGQLVNQQQQPAPSYPIRTPLFTAAFLAEKVNSENPGVGALSWQEASETLVFKVDWEDEYKAGLAILGTARTTPAGTLTRTLPLQHPTKQWLYAWSIDRIQRLGPRLTIANSVSRNVFKPYVMPSLKRYDTSIITVSFRPYMWNQYDDIDYYVAGEGGAYFSEDTYTTNPAEYQRWVEVTSEPSSEFLTRDGDTYQFAPKYDPPRQLKQPWVVLESKVMFRYKWHRVPEDFVCSRPGYADAFQATLNKVNKYQFMKNPAGTLLLTSYEIERCPAPWDLTNGQTCFYVNITANMLYFNPTNRGAYEVANDLYGHNLAPMPADNFKYHLVSKDGNATITTDGSGNVTAGQRRYNEENFGALYRKYDTPAGRGGLGS